MQIVIDIPEEDYQNLKAKDKFDDMCLNYYEKLIVRGTPLSKGHGKLKDVDEIKTVMFSYMRDKNKTHEAKYVMSVAKEIVDHQKTIIEADRGESE